MTPKPIWTWIQSFNIRKSDLDNQPEEIQSPKPTIPIGHPALLVEKETNGKTDVEMHLIQTAANIDQQTTPSNGNGAERN